MASNRISKPKPLNIILLFCATLCLPFIACGLLIPDLDLGMEWSNEADAVDPINRTFSLYAGNWNGSVDFEAASFDSEKECWDWLASRGAPVRSSFDRSIPEQLAVCLLGPRVYGKPEYAEHWQVGEIRDGYFHQSIKGDYDDMVFFAFDRQRLRVYRHEEMGGFSSLTPEQFLIHESQERRTQLFAWIPSLVIWLLPIYAFIIHPVIHRHQQRKASLAFKAKRKSAS